MLYPLWSCSCLFAGAQLYAVTLRREFQSELLCGRKQDIILEMKSTVVNIISQRKWPHDLRMVLLFHFCRLDFQPETLAVSQFHKATSQGATAPHGNNDWNYADDITEWFARIRSNGEQFSFLLCFVDACFYIFWPWSNKILEVILMFADHKRSEVVERPLIKRYLLIFVPINPWCLEEKLKWCLQILSS